MTSVTMGLLVGDGQVKSGAVFCGGLLLNDFIT